MTADPKQLAADSKLWDALAARRFSGLLYDKLIDRLARYGLSVVGAWLNSGLIFKKCTYRNKSIRLRAPVSWSIDDRDDLARSTVAVALRRFHREALQDTGWSPDGGVTIATFFVGMCIDAFPNEFRSWLRAAHRWRLLEPTDPADLDMITTVADWDPANVVQSKLELHRAVTSLNSGQRRAFVLKINGYTAGEIANVLEVTQRAVEGLIHRARRHLGDYEGRNPDE